MAYKNPILNFADKHPIAALIAVPMLMHLGGRALSMGIRTARFDRPLAALMPSQGSDDDPLRNLGYTGGSTAPQDMIQAPSHTPHNRYDAKARSSAFIDDPNYKTHKPNWNRIKPAQPYTAERSMAFTSEPEGVPIGLAGSNHSVFNGLSGVHKLNY
jgi:hypothetical protein